MSPARPAVPVVTGAALPRVGAKAEQLGMANVASGQKRAAEPAEPAVDLRPEGEAEPAFVDLAELVADRNGEVVLFNDSGLRSLAVGTGAAVVDRGEVGRHVTAAGEDVSGYRYVAFDNGLKLFHQPDLEVLLVAPEA